MKEFGKYNAPILYRCQSCGAAIRKDDKYHKLHVKGQPFIFCALCVELSDYIAYEKEGEDIRADIRKIANHKNEPKQ